MILKYRMSAQGPAGWSKAVGEGIFYINSADLDDDSEVLVNSPASAAHLAF